MSGISKLAELAKSLKGREKPGHKYVRRTPKAGGKYQYTYDEIEAEKTRDAVKRLGEGRRPDLIQFSDDAFDVAKMKALAAKDKFIEHAFNDLRATEKNATDERLWRVLFNSYVLPEDQPQMQRAYMGAESAQEAERYKAE